MGPRLWHAHLTPGASEDRWTDAIESATGQRCTTVDSVPGGDIARSFRVELASRERIFVKVYPTKLAGIGEAEAHGLAWLREVDAIRVPEVITAGPQWLALEWIASAPPGRDFDEDLGTGLAKLHRAGAATFGFDRDNWIGLLSQSNHRAENWAAFYADCRLRPLRDLALTDGRLPIDVARLVDEVIHEMPRLVGPEEAPARLHGDLWSGNVMVDERGSPCLIDPAVYAGHREIDLAMMRLFGGFRGAVFEAYAQEAPLAAGAPERIDLYQVYPLLVHVCLFGETYRASLERSLRRTLEILT